MLNRKTCISPKLSHGVRNLWVTTSGATLGRDDRMGSKQEDQINLTYARRTKDLDMSL